MPEYWFSDDLGELQKKLDVAFDVVKERFRTGKGGGSTELLNQAKARSANAQGSSSSSKGK